MKRLTKKSESGMVWFIDHENDDMRLEPCEMSSHHSRLAIEKLAAYEDAEEQGLLIRLHCKKGDTVYFIKAFFTIAKFPIEAKVTSICGLDFDNNVIYSAITKDGCRIRKFDSSDIGKTIFITKEQAWEALKKMRETEE